MTELKPEFQIYIGHGVSWEHAVTLKTGVSWEGDGVMVAYIERSMIPLLLALLAEKIEGAEVTINGEKVDLAI